MRYFHIVYDIQGVDGSRVVGSLTCSREVFIPSKDIKEQAEIQIGKFKSLIVTSIFEFNNEADFMSFIS